MCGRCYDRMKDVPLDAIMKIIYGFGAAMAELFYPPGTNKLVLRQNGHWVHMPEWQHFTMYSMFMLSGIVDIVSQKCLRRREETIEKTIVAMAFYITAMLLFYHQHGESLEAESHHLLFYANMGICASLTLEVWFPNDQKLVWLHTLLIMQMGSWLFHLAFILFGDRVGVEKWNENDHGSAMMLPLFYSWHLILNSCLMAAIHAVTWVYYKHKVTSSYSHIDENELQCCMPSGGSNELGNGVTYSIDGDDSDEDKISMTKNPM